MSRRRGTAAFLGLAGAVLAIFVIAGPARGQSSNSLTGSLFERAAKTDSVTTTDVADSSIQTSSLDSLAKVGGDSGLAAPDSATAVGDSSAAQVKPRSLPPRTLTLRQQVMFAGGFMAFIALMMASMQNFNP